MKIRYCSLAAVLILTLGCTASDPPTTRPAADTPRAKVVAEGYFDCFQSGLKDADGRTTSCEVSAVAFADGQLYLGNDKSVPGGSPITSLDWDGPELAVSPTPVQSSVIRATRKIEAATTTPDDKWVLATTAFDRVRDDSAEWNAYNSLIYFPAGHPEQAKVAHSSIVDGQESSVSLRKGLQRALADKEFPEGPPYFKIEALAALREGRLLFGIREVGVKYDDFRYVVRLLSVGYSVQQGVLRLDEEFERVYDSDLDIQGSFELVEPLGISSLEYDRYNDRLLLLTSFEIGEDDEDLGAYLWVLPIEDFEAGSPPTLVLDEEGDPMLFAHKAEGMAVVDGSTLVIVHDDDRVFGSETIRDPEREFQRKAHQAAWSVVRIR